MPGGDALAVEVLAGGSLRCSWAGAVLLGCQVWGFGLDSGFSYFLSLSYFFSFQTSLKLIEFKLRFEFKPYALNQIKQCTSMNAQTNLALE